jgi:hypothetical protein
MKRRIYLLKDWVIDDTNKSLGSEVNNSSQGITIEQIKKIIILCIHDCFERCSTETARGSAETTKNENNARVHHMYVQ